MSDQTDKGYSQISKKKANKRFKIYLRKMMFIRKWISINWKFYLWLTYNNKLIEYSLVKHYFL